MHIPTQYIKINKILSSLIIRSTQLRKKSFQKKNKTTKEIFTNIFKYNLWNGKESISGPGSSFEQTIQLRNELFNIIKNYNIKSILDIPCGDFHWMQLIVKDNIKYIGADIVKPLIKMNQKKYGQNKNRKFLVRNIYENKLPSNDLVICRDCFVHLPFTEILKSLKNIKKSGSMYLLSTTFPENKINIDCTQGEWRKINLEIEPFNLTKPLYIIKESCSDFEGEISDKSVGLWLIKSM